MTFFDIFMTIPAYETILLTFYAR